MLHKTLILIVMVALFTGCDKVKNTLGIDHYRPDEYEVMENPDLSIPPSDNLVLPTKDDGGKSKNILYTEEAKSIIGIRSMNHPKKKYIQPTTSHLLPQGNLIQEIKNRNDAKDFGNDDTIRQTVDSEEEKDPGDGPINGLIERWKDQYKKRAKSNKNF